MDTEGGSWTRVSDSNPQDLVVGYRLAASDSPEYLRESRLIVDIVRTSCTGSCGYTDHDRSPPPDLYELTFSSGKRWTHVRGDERLLLRT